MCENNDYNLFVDNLSVHLQDKISINQKFIDKMVQEVKANPELRVSINIKEIKDYGKSTLEVSVKDLIYYLQHLCKCQVTYSSQNTFTFFKILKPSLMDNTNYDYLPDIDTKPKTAECFVVPLIISTLILLVGVLLMTLLDGFIPSKLTLLPLNLSFLIIIIFNVGYYFNYYLTYRKSVKTFNYINNRLKGNE